MRKHFLPFLFPLHLLAFWLLFFAVFRLWFVLWFARHWSAEQPGRAWLSFWHALPLDLSFAAYLMAVPLLLWHFGMPFGPQGRRFSGQLVLGFNVLMFIVFIFVFGANVFVYEEWQTPLNNRAVEYFKTPRSLLDSMSLPFKLAAFALYAGFFWVVLKVYKRLVGTKIYPEPTARWGVLVLPVWLALLLFAIRGGAGVMPINESAVYFSPHLFDNHAATNPGWSLGHSLVETRSTQNRFRFFANDDTAFQSARKLVNTPDPTPASSSDSLPLNPNLVFLILESHTAQVVEELGGEPGVCPTLSRLIRQGLLFENIYGSGYRTDQGIVSVLAGYPAQPDQSIILLEDKAAKLRSIPKILKENDYATAFFYGGELTFANIGLWLTNQRFDKIFAERDFSKAEKTQRWGVDDHILLQRAAAEISKLPQPFFATAMTLSLHPPYDVPFQSQWSGDSDREKFLNSAAFVDHALAAFFHAAEQLPWYANTVFVLVADHGASQPGAVGMDRPESRHVPLIFFGKPLGTRWQGKRVSVFGNHHDVRGIVFDPNFLRFSLEKTAAPASRQPQEMDWYRPLLTEEMIGGPRKQGFAYYTNENGLGWATAQGKGFFEFGSQEWRIFEGTLDSIARANAQAYLQALYNDFLAK